jgi:hypothetical protein
MLLLLIVVPCTLVGVVVVAVLDRGGLLPRFDRPGPTSSRPVRSGNSIARPLSLGAILVLGTWILAWLVVLVVGLNIILSSS